MAVSMQSKCIRSSVPTRARSVRVEAVHGPVERAQIAAASFLAAALLVSPADAGVIMAKPDLKKAFQDSTPKGSPTELFIPRGALRSGSKAAPSAPAAKAPEVEFSSGGLDVRTLGLPASIGFVAGLAFVASKIDVEFDDFMSSTLIKDSNLGESGLGYEEVIKSTYGGIYGPATSAGTKKVKATKKK